MAFLSGTGIGAVSVSPTSLSFGDQVIKVTSAALNVTVTNNQNTPLSITKISTILSDYTNTSTCPISPKTLPAGASCNVSVFFTPSVIGTRSATLTIADNANVSPTVSLTGSGVLAAVASPATLTFGTQTQEVTFRFAFAVRKHQVMRLSVSLPHSLLDFPNQLCRTS